MRLGGVSRAVVRLQESDVEKKLLNMLHVCKKCNLSTLCWFTDVIWFLFSSIDLSGSHLISFLEFEKQNSIFHFDKRMEIKILNKKK